MNLLATAMMANSEKPQIVNTSSAILKLKSSHLKNTKINKAGRLFELAESLEIKSQTVVRFTNNNESEFHPHF